MGQAISEVLTPALVVALSPFQVIAAILMLATPRSRTIAPAFLVGWLLGLALVGSGTLLLSDPAGLEGDDGPTTLGAALQLGLGVLVTLLALKKWKKRPAQGETAEMPKWMAGISGFSPAKSFAMGVALSAINPKILIATIAAAVAVAQTGANTSQALIAVLAFIVLGSITVLVPIVWYLLSPQGAGPTLEKWNVWLTANNAVLMAVVFLVIGVNLISKGISGLTY